MYAEVRKPKGSSKLGRTNRGRLDGLAVAHEAGIRWIPTARLLADDALVLEGGGVAAALQLAYAQSWLLIDELMMPPKPTRFIRYLDTIRTRRDPKHRLDDARSCLGDLEQLDQSLRRAAANLAGVNFR
jgi:hypothetical protein